MQPYQPSMFHTPGVYRIVVGRCFYIGSSQAIGSRFSDHRVRLESGEHPNPLLQDEWDLTGEFSAFLVKEVPRKRHDTDADHGRRLKFHAQIELTQWFGTDGCANRSSESRFNSAIGDVLRRKWQDPEFRDAQVARMKARAGDAVTPETRELMAAAKKGARNINARACTLSFGGEEFRFDTATEAAGHFGVSQQLMDQWLRGVASWPGSGVRKSKKPHLIGLTGSYDEVLKK